MMKPITKTTAVKFNGNQLAKTVAKQLKIKIDQFIQERQNEFKQVVPRPKVEVFNVGNNVGSVSYIKKKMQLAEQLGIQFHLNQFNVIQKDDKAKEEMCQGKKSGEKSVFQILPAQKITLFNLQLQQQQQSKNYQKNQNSIQHRISQMIQNFNQRKQISAIFIQLPFPYTVPDNPSTSDILINMISPSKDPDCLTNYNKGLLYTLKQDAPILPCTAKGVLKILDQNKIQIQGRNVTIIGRSELVGKPLSHLLLNRHATVTVCHRKTSQQTIDTHTQNSDIVISAAGVPNIVSKVKKDSVLIDVGISRLQNGKLCGDISQDSKLMSRFYTPVPGGVGPLTVVMLMDNIIQLWKKSYTNN